MLRKFSIATKHVESAKDFVRNSCTIARIVIARQIIFVKLNAQLMKVASTESSCAQTFTAMKTITNVTTATTNAITFARFLTVD
jgi:hypothetical protein